MHPDIEPTHIVEFKFNDEQNDPSTFVLPVVATDMDHAADMAVEFTRTYDLGHEPEAFTLLSITRSDTMLRWESTNPDGPTDTARG